MSETTCEVCGRERWFAAAAQAQDWTRARIEASCDTNDIDCYRRGYERMRADRESFLAKKRDATAAASQISAERNEAQVALRQAYDFMFLAFVKCEHVSEMQLATVMGRLDVLLKKNPTPEPNP